MSIEAPNTKFFTKKHNSLLNISRASKTLAFVVFVAFALLMVANYRQMKSTYEYRSMVSSANESTYTLDSNGNIIIDLSDGTKVVTFWQHIQSDPSLAFEVFSNLFQLFVHGLALGVALLGISSGLNMIVETDLNYRLKKEEAIHE